MVAFTHHQAGDQFTTTYAVVECKDNGRDGEPWVAFLEREMDRPGLAYRSVQVHVFREQLLGNVDKD